MQLSIADVSDIVCARWQLVTFANGSRIYCEDGAPYREPTSGAGRHKGARTWKCGRKKNAATCATCKHRKCRCKLKERKPYQRYYEPLVTRQGKLTKEALNTFARRTVRFKGEGFTY